MAKTRSPAYPVIGLKEAVEKVRLVYDNDYQNPIPRDVAAAHMGYASLNGKSLGVLSALNKFGLLEGRADNTRVTDLAITIIAHDPGTAKRGEAIAQAAAMPKLFAEIDAHFPGKKVSDQAIRSYLLTQKFIPSAADAAIRSYRETKQLVENESVGYDSEDDESEGADMQVAEAATGVVKGGGKPPAPAQSVQSGFNIGFLGTSIQMSGIVSTKSEAAKVIDALTALQKLLPDNGDHPSDKETARKQAESDLGVFE